MAEGRRGELTVPSWNLAASHDLRKYMYIWALCSSTRKWIMSPLFVRFKKRIKKHKAVMKE